MSTQEEITIAKVVLAGWSIIPGNIYYLLVAPNGVNYGWSSTRYIAALVAEKLMLEDSIGLPDKKL